MTEPSVAVGVRGADPYDVVIGHGIGDQVIAGISGAVARVAIVHPTTLRAESESLRNQIAETGKDSYGNEFAR